MSYLITAWLERGEPRLGIVSAQSGAIKQQWRLDRITGESGGSRWRAHHHAGFPGMQQLVRELFLIGCAEEIGLMQRALMSDGCLSCGLCLEQAEAGSAVPSISTRAEEARKDKGWRSPEVSPCFQNRHDG